MLNLIPRSQCLFQMVVALLLGAAFAAPGDAAVFVVDCNVGPYLTIQDGVDDAIAAPGGTVLIHPCTYNENVVVRGGHEVHLVAAERRRLVGAEASGVGSPAFTSGVLIDGGGQGPCLTIEDSDRASVTGLGMTNCADQGIMVGPNTGFVKVHQNTLYDLRGMGMMVTNSTGAVITSNWITDVRWAGIVLVSVDTTHIADNVLKDASEPNSMGIYIDHDSRHVQTVNNEISGYQGPGLSDNGLKTRIERNSVESNCGSSTTSCGSCGCSEIQICPNSTDADVVGNETFPNGGWVLCGSGTSVFDNL